MNQVDQNHHQDNKQDLVNHTALQVLIPHIHSYALKGLTVLKSGGKKVPATPVEIYAIGVFERVSELDAALVSLRMALGFVMELGSSQQPDPKVYRYHYENFVLRVMGFVDRAYRLVGSALFIDKAKLEAIGGNTHVGKTVQADHPDVHTALERVTTVVKNYRGPRNELIHSAAYSSRELSVFMYIRDFGMDTKGIDVEELAQSHYSQGVEEIRLSIKGLAEAITNLLDALAPLFTLADANQSAV
ncbi:Cthe_2314 family HEPN domain-containing protein [Chromobacterium vaccinii]|uniref:Cthe_2314 family HEPN domain-containing protein n=1 Tax=Chromobacterium vaccinii TaxID=1108595 RepID=UPI001E3E7240|nr:Cthe_2314 family HEPN domain-containing protein [Chromobacterium vaccinii]MCD4501985.1 hypothetical protein [Chromobacterium vaccinii]